MSTDLPLLYHEHVVELGTSYAGVLAHHDLDAVIIAAGSAARRNSFDDQFWPLATTPTFAHWLPLPEADAVVVVAAGKPPRLIRVASEDFWETAPVAERDHYLAEFEISEVSAPADVVAHLPAGRVAVVASDPPVFDAPGPLNPPELVAALERLRTIKSRYEVACLTEATARAVRGHRRTAELFAGGDPSELDLHLAFLAATRQDDVDTPYKNIVARGRHASVLHYVTYQRDSPGPGPDSLLVDAGARFLGYAADVTRTWVRGDGAAADLFRAVVDGVDRLQRQVCDEVRPGMEYEALHDRSHQLLAEVLIETGVGRGSADELVGRGVTRALFPHGLGHSLGIQVHDVGLKPRAPRPDNPFLRNTSRIEVGQVFTIEPGCYVIDPLLAPLRDDDRAGLLDWKAVEAVRGFGGVRIEDNVVVTRDGVRNLTREAWAAA